MSRTILKIRPPLILLECPLEEGYKTGQIGWGAKYDKRYKAFKVPFCPQTLKMIHRLFKNPTVIEGQEHIEEMKVRIQNNFDGRQAMMLEKYPRPEGVFKLNPYEHQKDGLWYLRNFLGAALFADCGTGKTAMTLWDIEQKYRHKEIKPSSVLIVGKLMTLFSGWASDSLKFTDLISEVLWEPSRSKDEEEEVEIICDHGPKPKGKGKTRNQTEYFHRENGQPAILSGPRAFNPKKHIRKIRTWKEVNGCKYGTEKLITATRVNIRSNNIKQKICSYEAPIHIINHEGLILFEKELAARKYEYIVIDESTAIKNPSAKINSALRNIAKNTKYRRILSGTPSPQGPQDLWSQFYFLDNGLTLGPNYKEFLNQHFDMIRLGSIENDTFRGVKPCISPPSSRDTMGWIRRQLANRIFRCKLRDCIDLPPITIQKLDVFLSLEQKIHYENMKNEFCTQVDGANIEVTVDLAKIMKLRQITGGFIIDKEGEVKKVTKTNPKLEVLKDFITEIPKDEKVVIFAIYRAEIEMLLKHFGKKAVAIYGGVSDVKKLNAQDQFITNPNVRFIICQPQSAAYGVNGLTVARYLLFYSIDYRSDTDYQATKRIERNGQLRAMFVYYLIAKNTIDEIIYKNIKDKENIQQRTIDTDIVRELFGIRKVA